MLNMRISKRTTIDVFVYRFYYTKLSMFFVYDCIMLRLYAYIVAQVIDVAYIPFLFNIRLLTLDDNWILL